MSNSASIVNRSSSKKIMGGRMSPANVLDNGGRRLGMERRRFLYSAHIPERRTIKDRRNGEDRRAHVAKRVKKERRAIFL
jgi:hypothetical protein